MSKGLRHYPESQRMEIAMRRTKVSTKGCSYWGAVGFLNSKGIKTKEQSVTDAVGVIMNIAHLNNAQQAERKKKRANLRRSPRTTLAAALDPRSKRRLEALRAG